MISENKMVLTIAEAAKLTGIGRDTLYKLIKKEDNGFPYFKVQSRVYINRSLLENWINKISVQNMTI